MKVMITGITSFAGSHLVEFLMTLEGLEIYGIRRWRRHCAIFWTTSAKPSPMSRMLREGQPAKVS